MMFHKNQLLFALLLVGCSLICANQLDVSLANANIPETQPAVVDTTVAPNSVTEDANKKKTTTTTTTAAPETTTTTTTTTTAAPTTSTTTTTAKPSPTTTTSAPNTTTAAPITTTPVPAPFPDPVINTWNSSCIMIKMAAQLNFTYDTKDDKSANTLYNIPSDAKVYDSLCNSNVTQSMHINWGPADAVNMMLFQFDMKNKSVQLTMLSINIPLTSERFPDAKENQTIQLLHRGFDFSAPTKMSYHCTREQKFNLTETVANETIIGTIAVHDVQVEAFRSDKATGFSTVHDCDSSETSDIVPIAVGIALVALIVVVLISYLCARRNSTSRGYMSF